MRGAGEILNGAESAGRRLNVNGDSFLNSRISNSEYRISSRLFGAGEGETEQESGEQEIDRADLPWRFATSLPKGREDQ